MFTRKLVFPNPQHPPFGRPQGPRHQTVTLPVAGKFIFPERAVAFRFRSMLGTAMPETTIHEEGKSAFGENEIRFAEDFLMPPPADDFVPAK